MAEKNAPLFDALAPQALRKISDLQQQDLSNTAWAFATIVFYNDPLIEAIAAPALPQISL